MAKHNRKSFRFIRSRDEAICGQNGGHRLEARLRRQAIVPSELALAKNPVAVEKLLPAKFAKIKSRQEAPQSIFPGRVDIFYPPNFGCLGRKVSFSTATPDITH
jgi:hypothetical protein